MNTLAARYPKLLLELPFLTLTSLPTPLDRAENLGEDLGLEALWIKRDDLTGQPYGGNKVRKLEYLLSEAGQRECDAVVTFGAIGSNHVLATAIYAQRLGLECYGVLTDQPVTPYVAQTLRYHAVIGTRLVHGKSYSGVLDAAEQIARDHATGPDKVFQVPWGGSSWRGTVGFVNAAFELADQLKHAEAPDRIYVACGTMGTAVGLALGLRIAQLPTEVVAVQVAPAPVTADTHMRRLFEETNRELHAIDDAIPLFDDPFANLTLRSEFLGAAGYAEPTPECREACALMEGTESLHLDTTYTGKGLAALIHDARAGKLTGQHALFWNTYNSHPYPKTLNKVDTSGLPEFVQPYLG